MTPTPDIAKRISEIMTDMAKEQEELEAISLFIDNIEQASFRQMSGSASSARNRRKKSKSPSTEEGKSIEEEKKGYERRRAEKQEKIRLMWLKINQLQEEAKKI
ncbi:hypothetical protein BKA56DRAFT_596139 [Ilyonectria sp. MPI-CAGE-AT-0026]|nr:hypothetical protein BKA56DRAFT_596139 [Ilyonectria sp. MPI-CAGE-AT-0026]